MVNAARQNLKAIERNFKFKEIDAQSIPCDDETYDAVIANHMLAHVPDRKKAIAEIKRVLKPQGHLIASTVGSHHFKEMNDWLQRLGPGKSLEFLVDLFTLENGLEQLKPFFSQVTIVRYPDNLQMTEVEPIIAYIRSTIRAVELSEDEIAKIREELEKELKEKNMIFIRKDFWFA